MRAAAPRRNAGAYLSPKTLAAAIGVSESSLKRWADEGRLAVERTAGGHRRIAVPEALRFIRRSGLTPVRPELLGLAGEGVTRAAGLDRAAVPELLYQALREDRAAEARGLLVSLYVEGASLAWICDEVVRPALWRVGELWEHGAEGIVVEHRATETCLRVLAQLRALLPSSEGAPVAVGGALEGDIYQVPTAASALVLAEAGFAEHNLGADVPTAALHAAVRRYRPALVWLSASVPPRSTRDIARDLAHVAEALGSVPLVIGGRGADALPLPPAANVHHLHSMAELAAFARGVLAAGVS